MILSYRLDALRGARRGLMMLTAAATIAMLPATAGAQSDDNLFDDIVDIKKKPTPKAKKPKAAPKNEAKKAEPDAKEDSVAKPTPESVEEPVKAAPAKSASKKKTDTPLETLDRVKAVPKKAVLKRRRVEISASPGLSLNDAFFNHYSVSGQITWYPHDAFGIGIGGDYFYAHPRHSNQEVLRKSLTSVIATFEQPDLFLHLDAYWIPIHGKFSLFSQYIVHFDSYAVGGLGVASTLDGDTPFLANFGVGSRVYLNEWTALKVELRDYLYTDTFSINGQSRSDTQSYVMLTAGVSIFLPLSFEYSAP